MLISAQREQGFIGCRAINSIAFSNQEINRIATKTFIQFLFEHRKRSAAFSYFCKLTKMYFTTLDEHQILSILIERTIFRINGHYLKRKLMGVFWIKPNNLNKICCAFGAS